MCQAIVKPKGILIEKGLLNIAWQQNADGAGFAVRHPDGRIEIMKGFFKFKKFWNTYRHYEYLDCLIHFRYATHGALDHDNCHPFEIGQQAAIIHNGILDKFIPHESEPRSDTRLLVDTFITPAWMSSGVTVAEFFNNAVVKSMLHSVIGGNKLAVLTTDGFHIVNEIYGEWYQGVWYSAGKPISYVWRNLPYTGMHPVTSQSEYDDDDLAWMKFCQESERTQGKLNVVTGWDEEDEEEEYDEDGDSIEECALCYAKHTKLYQVGVDALCATCWDEYTGTNKRMYSNIEHY